MDHNIKLPPNFDLRASNAASEWRVWRLCFEDYLIGSGQEQAADKVKLSLLRNMLGLDATRIVTTSLQLSTEESFNFECVMDAITKYVSPRVNEVFERFKLNDRKQKQDESFENFLTDCKQLIMSCNYRQTKQESLEDQLLRDKIVHGVYDKNLQECLLKIDNLTLERAANCCRASEQSKKQVQEMNPTIEIDYVRKQQQNKKTFKCRRCQTKHGHRECPAYGKKCTKCGNLNHFAISCRVKNIGHAQQDSEDSEDDALFCGGVASRSKIKEWSEIINVEGKNICCRIDTGADVSIMPRSLFKRLKTQLELRPTKKNLEAFQGSKIKPIGKVYLQCKYKDRECYEDFMVVDCNSMLLGLPACLALNLVKRVHSVKMEDNLAKENFINQNLDIFQGNGKFPKQCSIPTVPHEQICHPAPRIPYTLHEPLKAELNRLVERGAIVKVDDIDSQACINRVVIVEKQNKKIRLCLDPSDLNKSIVRKPKTLLTVEEIAAKLLGKKMFSVFDLSEAFHCIPLTEESSWKCCFSTPFGVFRYLVLPYGLCNSPDLFQDQIEGYFGDIPNVITWFDDILIMGETEEIHDQAVSKVIARAREINAVFNKDKLQYKQPEVKYVGQIFNGSGMYVDKARVESLIELNEPTNRDQLQQMIGSFNYVRRYVPEMAELMAPLCKLLRKDVEFQWLPFHSNIFKKLKNKISSAPALCPFNSQKQIILQCDASKNGIGCCLFQKGENNVLNLVACVSRTMNDCELNYSQTEKELLAIYFGTQKFHKYVYGSNVLVQTDHKPLLSIMIKPISKVGSPRLRRLCLKLLNYTLELKYVPGKDVHFADMLSRNSLRSTDKDPQMLEMVHSVSVHLPMSEERKAQFKRETSLDSTLSELYLVAKPVSLNELIAAESKQKQNSQHTKPTAAKTGKTVSLNELIAAERKQKGRRFQSTKPTGAASTPKTYSTKESSPSESRQNLEKSRFTKISAIQPRRKSFSLKDIFAADKTQAKRRIESLLSKSSGAALFPHRHKVLLPSLSKHFESAEDIFSFARSISPLKFRKKFEISSPLKPRKIKYSFTPRYKRRNQSTKREANDNEVFNHRYIPLIKRIGLLVDDFLSPESSESIEPRNKRRKPRRNPKLPNKRKDSVYLASSEPKPQKATVAAPSTVSPETTDTEDPTSETPHTTAYTTPVGDVNTLRPDPDLPLPSTRNPSSDRRNHLGVSEGSGPAFHADFERHITRHNGSDEYNSRGGRYQTYSSYNQENSGSSTRIHTCSDGSGGGTNAQYRNNSHETEETKITSDGFIRRNDTEGKNTFQIGGQQEALQIPRNVRLSGLVPDNKVLIVNAESVPPQKSREESFFNVTNHHTNAERGSEWNGTAATENQRVRQVVQGMIPINNLLNPDFLRQHTQNNQIVTIFDGYSVARDINGRNKLTEKSIRISPN